MANVLSLKLTETTLQLKNTKLQSFETQIVDFLFFFIFLTENYNTKGSFTLIVGPDYIKDMLDSYHSQMYIL